MTCIVGVEFNDKVYMGCDSAATDGYMRTSSIIDEKIFVNDGTMVGMCGSFRFGQILKYSLTIPDRGSSVEDDMSWLVNDYIDSVRAILSDKGHIIKGEHTPELIVGSDYLLGYNGKLYYVEDNFQILRMDKGYLSTGCGADYANGVMHHIKTTKGIKDPVKFLLYALDAAATHSAACAPPHHVFCLDMDGEFTKLV